MSLLGISIWIFFSEKPRHNVPCTCCAEKTPLYWLIWRMVQAKPASLAVAQTSRVINMIGMSNNSHSHLQRQRRRGGVLGGVVASAVSAGVLSGSSLLIGYACLLLYCEPSYRYFLVSSANL